MAHRDWVDLGNWFSNNDSYGCEPVALEVEVSDISSPISNPLALRSLPLQSRHVNAQVDADLGVSETTETLTYLCEHDCSVNFRFPLPPKTAVYEFEANLGDRTIRTTTKKLKRARTEFNTAVSQGHTAVLLEQKSSEIFSIRLGNLPAGKACQIRISYLALLDKVDNTVEYLHTSTWVPPYVSGDLSAEEVAKTTPAFASNVSYQMSYKVQVHCQTGFKGVDTADKVETSIEGNNCTIQQSAEVSDPSRDFQLLIALNNPQHDKTAAKLGSLVMQERARSGPTKQVVKATFIPDMPVMKMAGHGNKKEMWLVVDCSGSMDGNPMGQAREAALFFVKDLPTGEGVKFNIVAFGSSYRFLYNDGCRMYHNSSQAEAVKWIQDTLSADMGGTEIRRAMQAIYDIPISQGYNRQIIFLTDGGIYGSEEQKIYAILRQGKKFLPQTLVAAVKSTLSRRAPEAGDSDASCQIFCLGIGHGVHRGLLEGMASRTNGLAAYVTNNENIAAKASMLKKCALGSGLLRRPKLTPRACTVNLVPAALPGVLFPGQPLTLMAEVTAAEPNAALKLSAELPGGAQWSQELKLSDAVKHEGDMLPVLHAMGYISELLQGKSQLHVAQDGTPQLVGASDEDVEEEVVRVATAENLVTPHTATVGVLCHEDPLDPSKVTEVDIPIQLPTGRSSWSGAGVTSSLEALVPQAALGCITLRAAHVSACTASSPVGLHARGFKSATRSAAGGPVGSSEKFSFGSLLVGATRSRSSGQTAEFSKQSARCASCTSAPPDQDMLSMEFCAAPTPPPCPAAAGYENTGPVAAAGATPGAGSQPSAAPMVQSATYYGSGAPLLPVKRGSMESKREEENMSFGLVDDGFIATTEQAKRKDCGGDAAVGDCGRGMLPAGKGSGYGAAPAAVPSNPNEMLSQLNLARTVEGFWHMDESLLQLVGQKGKASVKSGAVAVGAELRAAKPAALGEEEWATVLVLAFLRKHLTQERSLWEAMVQKAELWLQQHWPEEAASMAGTILTAMKML